jgi:hypothetical protein
MTADAARWAITGTYLESCNCEAICPCRSIGGRHGGRSTYGVCLGALSWRIDEGHADGVGLAGLAAVLLLRYSDDEPGSPWTFVLYVDEHGDDRQRKALVKLFTGQLGGTPLRQFPWAFKPSNLRAARPAKIEIDHSPGRGWFRAGDEVLVRIGGPVDAQGAVTCLIPGHHRDGRELYAEVLSAGESDPLSFEFRGNCGYESTFSYSSAD